MGQQPPDCTGSDVEETPRPANAGTRAIWVLPVVHPREAPTPGLESALVRAAAAAAAGDTDARNALYFALAWPIAGYVARYRRRAFASGGIWGLDDVGQEAYLALVETIDEWSGVPPFLPYFAIRFPRRLADAVQRLDRRGRPVRLTATGLLLHDDSAASEESLALLEAIAAALPEQDRAILLLRVRDGHGFGTIAGSLGLSRRAVYRHWSRVLAILRGSLTSRSGTS